MTHHKTQHRPDCDRPEAKTQASKAIRGLTITRCPTCGAVSLERTNR